MAKTTFTVPFTGDILTARNSREERACRHFVLAIECAIDIYREELAGGYECKSASEAYEHLHYRAGEIEGFARALDWLGVMTRESRLHYIRSIFAIDMKDRILAEMEASNECA